jgi:hypothetical protein
MVVDDVVIPPRVELPDTFKITLPSIPPQGDVFTKSLSEIQAELHAQVLSQVLTAYRVSRVEDLPSYEDEEDVVTIVGLIISQGFLDV